MDEPRRNDEEGRRDDPVRDGLRQLLLVFVLIGTVSGVIGFSRGPGFLITAGVCLLGAVACFLVGMRRMDRR